MGDECDASGSGGDDEFCDFDDDIIVHDDVEDEGFQFRLAEEFATQQNRKPCLRCSIFFSASALNEEGFCERCILFRRINNEWNQWVKEFNLAEPLPIPEGKQHVHFPDDDDNPTTPAQLVTIIRTKPLFSPTPPLLSTITQSSDSSSSSYSTTVDSDVDSPLLSTSKFSAANLSSPPPETTHFTNEPQHLVTPV